MEIKKVEHKNIYEALSAFQGENPEIKKTKDFGRAEDKMHFKYAPLDEILSVVRPLTSKHGLSITWEEKDGKIVCALYHTTYEAEPQVTLETTEYTTEGEAREKTASRSETRVWEQNVLRSMPVSVSRSGDMKEIGKQSTYARRYTLSEVLGIAPDDDMDDEKLRKNVENFAFNQAKTTLKKTKGAERAKQVLFLESELFIAETLESGKMPKSGIEVADTNGVMVKKSIPSLGLKAEQYKQLLAIQEEVQEERK